MFEIRQVVMEDGERLFHLADKQTGLPVADVTRFMIVEVRPSGASSGTIRNKLAGIGVGLTLLSDLGIDLEQRIRSGRFLDDEELLFFSNRFVARANGQGRISGSVAADRYVTFLDFVAFRAGELRGYAPDDDQKMITTALASFKARAGRHRPRPTGGSESSERLGLDPAVRLRFLEVIQPGHPENPFQKALQVRNHAILLLAYTFGFRSGEEFSLKRSDFDDRSTPATITINRRADDVDETRREPALVKTHGRTLPIEGEALAALEAWLAERGDRNRYPAARKHPFIFVSRLGDPLTLRRGRQLYEQLRAAHPELAGLVQHQLRHDANDRWTEDDRIHKPDPAVSRQERNYAMGWSEQSAMPDRYSKKSIRAGAAKRMERIQKEGMGQKK
ncbi:MAG: tyrosine-type recombinase/integrase [Sphingomonas sp.]|uniref:tyrosine-type recombinase/integrase n=1 Tax=Sphingomonas sp. TaxID=28214 RepID=UPI0026296A4B|nr:tyrosine-type recombinase/integrase [Sphingomonas sp.]MDK2768396.1 tyrosine-type recombinase/integrase [Sphingomonas sp.]